MNKIIEKIKKIKEKYTLFFSKKQPKNKKKFCPSCEEYTDNKMNKRKETYTVEGKIIEVDVETRLCSICGESFLSEDEETHILNHIYAKYDEIK